MFRADNPSRAQRNAHAKAASVNRLYCNSFLSHWNSSGLKNHRLASSHGLRLAFVVRSWNAPPSGQIQCRFAG